MQKGPGTTLGGAQPSYFKPWLTLVVCPAVDLTGDPMEQHIEGH